jgi:dihydrofolate synthase/folylpolyglutamate synthase
LAGTNGKGSVAAMVEASLREAGYETGMYVSPHLVRFTERFKVGGREIEKEDVLRISQKVWQVVDEREPPTFFEFVTAMAFVWFAEKKADPVILETGMGGRLDATNICSPLISVITTLGLEHQEYLGPTLTHIAREKAGIIKPGVPCVHGVLQKNAKKVIEDTAESLGSPVVARGRDISFRRFSNGSFNLKGRKWDLKNLTTSLVGRHQPLNACLALGVLEELSSRGYEIREEDIRRGLAGVRWPGRLDKVRHRKGEPAIWLDGAHNVPAAKALVESLGEVREGCSRLVMVLGVMADKDLEHILGLLTPAADQVVFSRPQYKRAADPRVLAEAAPRGLSYETEPELKKAIKRAADLAGPDGAVLITGSLFTVGEAMAVLEAD